MLDLIHQKIRQMRTLLLQRKFDDIKPLAQETLTLCTEQPYTLGTLRCHILLGETYKIQSRYNNYNALLIKAATHHYNSAASISTLEIPTPDFIEIQLGLAELSLFQKDYSASEKIIQALINHCKKEVYREGEILCLIAFSKLHLEQNDLPKAIHFAQIANDLLKTTDKSEIRLATCCQLLTLYIRNQEYSKLAYYSDISIKLSKELGDLENEALALNMHAVYYAARSEYKYAVAYFLETLKICERINYRQGIVFVLINMGTIYANIFNYEAALERYHTVLEQYSDLLDVNRRITVLNNIGHINWHLSNFELARKQYEEVLEMSKSIGQTNNIAHSFIQISRTLVALKHFDEALDYANQAQTIIDGLENYENTYINFINKSNIYYNKEDYSLASSYAFKGITGARLMRDKVQEIVGYRLLANIYKQLNDFKKAFEYQSIYSEIRETLAKEQQIRLTIDQEIKLDIQKKEQAIELLTQENQYQALLLEKNHQIEQQNLQLQQVNEEIKQFAYATSHDLKEPLRMIKSYTQLVERSLKNPNEDQQMYFNFISEGVVRMQKLLEGLLQYATVGKYEIEIELIDLNKLIADVQDTLSIAIQESNTTISVSTLPSINSNNSLLGQLFQNLLANAIKFRKPNTSPEISITSEELSHEYIFRVQDNGIGIAPEFQEKIFLIFQRLHKRNEYEGTGIGLSICQKIVHKLGGRIWVESAPNQGSCFCFALPK